MRTLFFTVFCMGWIHLGGQSFSIPSDTLLLGQKVAMAWDLTSVDADSTAHVYWAPVTYGDSTAGVAFVDVEWLPASGQGIKIKGDTISINGGSRGNIHLRFFTSGSFVLLRSGKTEADAIVIGPKIPEGDIEDIRDIESFPPTFDWKELWIWLGLLVFIALLAWLLIKKYLRKTEYALATSEMIPTKTLEERLLEIQSFVGDEHKLQWATDALASLLRDWCASQYGIKNEELTTMELIKALRHLPVLQGEYEEIVKILQSTDLIKFAKAVPTWNETWHHCEILKQLIQKSRS